MRRHIGTSVFEDQDFSSILKHAKHLEGKRLDWLAGIVGKPDLLQLKGKGAAGQLVQAWFGIDQFDGRPEADLVGVKFPDDSIGTIEIKIVPITEKKDKNYRIKERCKITNIDYDGLLKEKWDLSRARKKLLSVLFIFYEYAGATSWETSEINKVLIWEIEKEKLKDIIQSDWEKTFYYVDQGRAHEISEGHNMILGASTAGQGGETKHVVQPKNQDVLARKRAFSLKPAFLQTTYELEKKSTAFESIKTLTDKVLPKDLQQGILDSLQPYVGLTLGEIVDRLDIPRTGAKSYAALVMKRALGILNTKKKILELEAIGVRPKIIPVKIGDLKPCEAMSFPATVLTELAEEDWESSELRLNLDCLLMLPTFTPRCEEKDRWSRRLGRPFFWTPSSEEEAEIAKEWAMFKQEVKDGKAAYRIVNEQRKSQLTRSAKTTFIHMRPKGKDGSEDDIDPSGNKTQKLCFWLNQSFVKSILIAENRKIRLI